MKNVPTDKTTSDQLIHSMLTEKSVQYNGLYREINWSLYDDPYLTELIIENPDQILMRIHIIENLYIKDIQLIEKMLVFFAEKSCSTYAHILAQYGKKLDLALVYILSEQRLQKISCSYYTLGEVQRIRRYCVLSPLADAFYAEKQKVYEVLEKIRYAQGSDYAGARH